MLTPKKKIRVGDSVKVNNIHYVVEEMFVADSSTATVDYLAFDINAIKDEEVKVSDEEVKKYYEEHKEYYIQRDQRKIKYAA